MRGQSFRLKTPTLGIFNDKETTVVPANALITVLSDPDSTNHVYALYDGRKILMFVRDIQERGTALDVLFVFCEAGDHLFHEYNAAVLGVSQAVAKLADLAGTSSGSDYELLSRENDRAKARLKKARAAYERHIVEHGCGERAAALG